MIGNSRVKTSNTNAISPSSRLVSSLFSWQHVFVKQISCMCLEHIHQRLRSVYICLLLPHPLRSSFTTSSLLYHALLELPLPFLQCLGLLLCLIIATSDAKAAEKSGCKFYHCRKWYSEWGRIRHEIGPRRRDCHHGCRTVVRLHISKQARSSTCST